MFNKRVLAVFKREVREKFFSKGFIIMTILLPAFMFGLIGIQVLLRSEGATKYDLVVAGESGQLLPKINKELNHSGLLDENFSFRYIELPRKDLDSYLEKNKQALLDERITGIIYIPDSALVNKKIEYYSKTPSSIKISENISRHINNVLMEEYFLTKKLSSTELEFVRTKVDFTGYKVSRLKGIEEEGYGNMVLAYLFTFLLYISMLMMGQMIMQSVIEEKSSRIVEVILSSVSPRELMTAKILGAAFTGAMQMLIWLSPIILVISTTWFMLPRELIFDINAGMIIYFLVNFFLGLILFLGLFATVGAIFDNPQDAQSGLWPVMMLIIIPFFIALSMMENPNSVIGKIASLFPFTNIIVMPARMVISEVPVLELVAGIFVSVFTILLIFPVAGKIYRVGILMSGKKPKWGEVIRWLKFKY